MSDNDTMVDISEENLPPPPPPPPTPIPNIRHIVLSGGGAQGLSFYGFLRETNKAGLWDINNIKTIHGTSIGAFIGAIICLGFEWEIIDDYLIKRPWHTVFKLDLNAYLRVFEAKGMISKTFFEDVMKPLFSAKDIPLHVTLREFYEITGVEFHAYITDMNQLCIIDVSYKTHPDWTVVKTLHCTCNVPIVFEPYIEDGKFYIDGGTLVNYPINQCISNGANPDEILGVCKRHTIYSTIIDETSSFFDYILGLLSRVFDRLVFHTEGGRPIVNHEYYVTDKIVNIDNLAATAASAEERLRLIQVGVDLAKEAGYLRP